MPESWITQGVFDYRDDDKPLSMAPVAPQPPAIVRDLPSATGSGEVVRHVGRVPAIDGHQPAVVGQWLATRTTTDADGREVPDETSLTPTGGRPMFWATTEPTWSDSFASNVKRGRNKRGTTAEVKRHGVLHVAWDVPDQSTRLDAGSDVLALTDRDAGQVATEWVRTHCMACVETREACDDGRHGCDDVHCPACQNGCGCMANPEPMTVQRADVVDGPLASDLSAPSGVIERYKSDGKNQHRTWKRGEETARSIARRGKRRDWVAETQSRADSGWASHCPSAIAHASLGDIVRDASASSAQAEMFANIAADNRKSLAHGWQHSWRGTSVRRNNQLRSDAEQAAAGVTNLGTDANGNTVLGRRTSSATELVAWGLDGYWVGHRFVKHQTASDIEQAAIAEREAKQAATDATLTTVLEQLAALDIGHSQTIAGQPVERTPRGYLLDGTERSKPRTAAKLTHN